METNNQERRPVLDVIDSLPVILTGASRDRSYIIVVNRQQHQIGDTRLSHLVDLILARRRSGASDATTGFISLLPDWVYKLRRILGRELIQSGRAKGDEPGYRLAIPANRVWIDPTFYTHVAVVPDVHKRRLRENCSTLPESIVESLLDSAPPQPRTKSDRTAIKRRPKKHRKRQDGTK